MSPSAGITDPNVGVGESCSDLPLMLPVDSKYPLVQQVQCTTKRLNQTFTQISRCNRGNQTTGMVLRTSQVASDHAASKRLSKLLAPNIRMIAYVSQSCVLNCIHSCSPCLHVHNTSSGLCLGELSILDPRIVPGVSRKWMENGKRNIKKHTSGKYV